MTSNRTTILHFATLVGARLVVTLGAHFLGFDALSDDDFARVTLAQEFATSPRLDPTGTSWLPFPFWLNGSVMALFGTDLLVAKATSLVLACLSGIFLYAVARWSRIPARAAWLGTLLWTVVPGSVFTGAATVPELPTAVLCASALLLLRRSDARSGLLAAAILIPATLSRYEAWPVAVCVVISIGIPSMHRNERDGAAGFPIIFRLVAGALALLGPVAWIAWNAAFHGDPFHFHARVSTYWFAWSASPEGNLDSFLLYPKSVIMDVPVLTLSLLGALLWSKHRNQLTNWLRPALAGIAVMVALMLAQGTGGAPTHHPERTLLFLWALGWLATSDLLMGTHKPVNQKSLLWQCGLPLSAMALMMLHTVLLAPSYGVDRKEEVQLGTWLNHNTEGLVLLYPMDFGFFAIMAAMGNDRRIVLSRSVDPREADRSCAFENEEKLRDRIRKNNVSWLVASGEAGPVAEGVGEKRYKTGNWMVVQVP